MTKGDNMTLTGTVTGPNQESLFKQAQEEAATYYGLECVEIRPLAQHSDGNNQYTLDWAANIQHHWQDRPSGIRQCTTCKKEPK